MLGNVDDDFAELDSFDCCPHNEFDCDIPCTACGHLCVEHHSYDDDSCFACDCDSFVDPEG